MTYLNSWEEFEKGAERLYLQDPLKVLNYGLFIFYYKLLLFY